MPRPATVTVTVTEIMMPGSVRDRDTRAVALRLRLAKEYISFLQGSVLSLKMHRRQLPVPGPAAAAAGAQMATHTP